MIEHVFRRVSLCPAIDEVYVATCDEEIRSAAKGFRANVIMTSGLHERAVDRVAEAAGHFAADIVVMIQGDEPMITPEMIHTALDPLQTDSSISCVNQVHRITTQQEFIDPNTIKVVADLNGNALYFSRSPIPHVNLNETTAKVFKQVCVIPFTRQSLEEFSQLSASPLERVESIDMLRLLEHGRNVRLAETFVETHSVDTPADLQFVQTLMNDDPLLRQYVDLD